MWLWCNNFLLVPLSHKHSALLLLTFSIQRLLFTHPRSLVNDYSNDFNIKEFHFIASTFVGGCFAEKVGGKCFLGLRSMVTAVFTLLTPIAAKWGTEYLIAVRVLEGLGEVSKNDLKNLQYRECDTRACVMFSSYSIPSHRNNLPSWYWKSLQELNLTC